MPQPPQPGRLVGGRRHDRRPLGPLAVGARDGVRRARRPRRARPGPRRRRNGRCRRARAGRGPWPTPCSALTRCCAATRTTARPAGCWPTPVRRCSRVATSPAWPWPEQRLTYANAVLPEAMIVLGDDARAAAACVLRASRCSAGCSTCRPPTVTSPSSRSPGSAGTTTRGRASTSSPSRSRALAEACRTAYDATCDDRWLEALACAARGSTGDNDAGLVMHDDVSGGGLRRPRGRVGQRQPGRRVDARLAVHRADVRARGRRGTGDDAMTRSWVRRTSTCCDPTPPGS